MWKSDIWVNSYCMLWHGERSLLKMKSVWDYVMVVCNGGLLSKWYFLELCLSLSLSIRALIFQNGCLHAVLLLIQLTNPSHNTNWFKTVSLPEYCKPIIWCSALSIMQGATCAHQGESAGNMQRVTNVGVHMQKVQGVVWAYVCVYGLT